MRRIRACALTLSFLSTIEAFQGSLVHRQRFHILKATREDGPQDVSAALNTLQRTASRAEDRVEEKVAPVQKKKKKRPIEGTSRMYVIEEEKNSLYNLFLQKPGNFLKSQLKKYRLPVNGRKPDLARRLADFEIQKSFGTVPKEEDEEAQTEVPWTEAKTSVPLQKFAGLHLSKAAGEALGKATFGVPSPIQKAAIPMLSRGQSMILHAETGSGKTLAYLLPITERLWRDYEQNEYDSGGYCAILTPTRELAAQVAGVAQALSPKGSVRLISHPTNLMKERDGERGMDENGVLLRKDTGIQPRLFVGSAKAIMHSLYGDGVMPSPPTPKPSAMNFLRNIRWLVLDEVDRILHVKKSRSKKRFKQHEKPAALVTSAVARLTMGESQIIAASATVGRPLRRELSRVLGLPPEECPVTVRGSDEEGDNDWEVPDPSVHPERAVSVPETVENIVMPVDGNTTGKMLTSAHKLIQAMSNKPRKILLVLTRMCDFNIQNVVGALKFFRTTPEPQSLLDALEAEGTDLMIEKHREVSGATGIGETDYFGGSGEKKACLLVVGEDSIRGLHLDGLDAVVIMGRPNGPDEYTHIAGRTGRAGKRGNAISILPNEKVGGLRAWEQMLGLKFKKLSDPSQAADLP